jgi:hypothetical protein
MNQHGKELLSDVQMAQGTEKQQKEGVNFNHLLHKNWRAYWVTLVPATKDQQKDGMTVSETGALCPQHHYDTYRRCLLPRVSPAERVKKTQSENSALLCQRNTGSEEK